MQIGQTNCWSTFLNSGIPLSIVSFLSSSALTATRSRFSTFETSDAVQVTASVYISVSSLISAGRGIYSSSDYACTMTFRLLRILFMLNLLIININNSTFY